MSLFSKLDIAFIFRAVRDLEEMEKALRILAELKDEGLQQHDHLIRIASNLAFRRITKSYRP